MPPELLHKVAWLNGASGTIGRAVADALVRAGATVVLTSRTQSSLELLAHSLASAGPGRAEALAVDLTRREPVDAAAARIADRHGRIDLLVNSTSVSMFGDFARLGDDEWETVFHSKLFAYVRTMRATLPHMVRQGDGRIVNVSGRGGHQPTAPSHLPGMSANAAVNLLTKGLANTYGAQGIRVNAVAPGPVASPRYDAIAAANERVADPATLAAGPGAPTGFGTAAPRSMQARPEDIADVVLFLLSDRSKLMNGTVLQCDGGTTASL